MRFEFLFKLLSKVGVFISKPHKATGIAIGTSGAADKGKTGNYSIEYNRFNWHRFLRILHWMIGNAFFCSKSLLTYYLFRHLNYFFILFDYHSSNPTRSVQSHVLLMANTWRYGSNPALTVT